MGCLKKIISSIIAFILIYAFFAFGGFQFVKDKYDTYTSPERSVFVNEEKDFGNLENISADYALSRSLNFFGYRKLNAYYLPKKQRITVIDLNSDNVLTKDDFKKGVLEEKLENFSSKFMNSPIVPISDIEITNIGQIKAGNEIIPYADFQADVKMIPFFKAKGTVAIYKSKNRENIINKIKKDENITSKLVISCKFPTGYEDKVTKNFISQIKF